MVEKIWGVGSNDDDAPPPIDKKMDGEDRQSRYLNTMVFAIVAGLISLMLLLLILNASEMVKSYSFFIITVEIGLVLVIGTAIYRIIRQEYKLHKEHETGLMNKVNVDSCPDYWTRSGNTCKNELVTPSYRLVLAPTAASAPGGGAARSIKLDDYNNKSVADVCKKIKDEKILPWTDIVSVCDSYRIAT